MKGNIDTIYKNICQRALWIVCPFCKYFAEVLPVTKSVFNMILTLSPHIYVRPLQKAIGLCMEEVEIFKECCEWLEFSQRTTVVFTSLLKEFEDLLEHFEIDTLSEGSSDDSSTTTITQCRRDCHLSKSKTKELTTEYNTVVCQNAAKALTPNVKQLDEPASTTTRHKLSRPTAAEEAGLTSLCSQQQLHVYQRGANKPTPARLPLLRCPPSGVQTQPGVVEAKSAPIMIFSEGPQIHLISQELRAKLESHVRRKRTHHVFGFPPKLAKLLGDSAASVLKSQGTCHDWQAPRSFTNPNSAANPNRNAADHKDCVFLNVFDLKNAEQLEETKAL